MSRASGSTRFWALVAILVAGLAAPLPAAGQNDLTGEQREDVQALLGYLDQALAGEETPRDIPMSWQNHYLRASDNLVYVPFTLTLDEVNLSNRNVGMLLRVTERDSTERHDSYPFEDVHFFELRGSQPYKVSRAFAVPAGEYDVYVAMKEATPSRGGAPEDPKTAVFKQSVTVPDLWSGELTTSALIVAESFGPVTGQLTEEEQRERPYTLGNAEIVPVDDTDFTVNDDLTLVFLVYGPALADGGKPDVTVNYDFYERTANGEEYFNRTPPQEFNAQTLQPEFDMAAGHQLLVGQSVPLASFPEGEYRLEVRVTDNAADTEITRDVMFSVR